MNRMVHVVGTGTIGEPLIGLLSDFKTELGIDEVTFSKRQALLTDRSKVKGLIARGAKLCSHKETWDAFKNIDLTPSYGVDEAFEKASVIIDCTPAGNKNKDEFYKKHEKSTAGFIAQGSEFGFGKMYARGINDSALVPGEDKYIHVVSCNTHNLAVLIKTLGFDQDGTSHLENGRFLCIRRANDISQDGSFVPSPVVNKHSDEEFGTHHARDAFHLFQTMGKKLNLFSSAMKINSQYMHTVWFNLKLGRDTSLDEVIAKLEANPLVALTHKVSGNSVFSFGRDHGHFGRILNQTVVPLPGLSVQNKREITGFCFTPQDGNALLSSVAASCFFLDPESYHDRIQPMAKYFFDEV